MTGYKKRLHIDIETYGEVDLGECGVYAYANHPSFEILLIGYAYDDDSVQQIDLAQGEEPAEQFFHDLMNPEIAKVAHNATFERVCLSAYYRKRGLLKSDYIDAGTNWNCTSVRAAELGMPRSLKDVGDVLHLSEENYKLSTGKLLINYFCKPCKPTKINGQRTRNYYFHDVERWEAFKRYNIRDVVAEREIDKIELSYESTRESEHEMYVLDQRINDQGVAVDMVLIDQIINYVNTYTEGLLNRAKEITELDNPNSLIQVKSWLAKKGVMVNSLDKEALEELLQVASDKEVREYLTIRKEIGKTSVAKYEAMKRAAIYDKKTDTWRVHGMLMFYGAMRTGRWAGRIVQVQNLPKNSINDLALAREWARNGEWGLLEMGYENIMDVFSQLIRTALIPARGNKFVVSDYNAIEARVIAWFADENWKLDVFRRGGKIYEETASRMFKVPIESITHDSPERAKGKVAELAGGYGGGVEAYKRFGAERFGLDDKEIQRLVKSWRDSNKNIVELWDITENAMREAIEKPGAITKVTHGAAFRMQKDTLFLRLPCGRCLAYRGAGIQEGARKSEIAYLGENATTGHYEMIRTYGGRIVENLVQATARDCLAFAVKELMDKGYNIRFHVHDEVIVEVPENDPTAETEVPKLMADAIAQTKWGKDIPLRAESYECSFYLKQ